MSYYIFYHARCPDGELSAGIFNLYKKDDLEKINYYPWYHHKKEDNIIIFEKLKNDDIIYFLDVCPTPEIVDKYLKNNFIIIIDHHKDAVNKMKEYISKNTVNIYLYYDFNKSGCMLTWDYLSIEHTSNGDIIKHDYPKCVKYIGNYDIWNYEDENTEPFIMGYNEFFKLDNLDNISYIYMMELFIHMNDDLYNCIINKGKDNIILYKNKVKSLFSDENNIKTLTLMDEMDKKYNVISVYCQDYYIYKYICEYVKENYSFYDVLRIEKENNCYSLRSNKKNVYVDSIARKYGGNGHPLASGYNDK
jgi:hypothetical protein